jgi:hypothetical protein
MIGGPGHIDGMMVLLSQTSGSVTKYSNHDIVIVTDKTGHAAAAARAGHTQSAQWGAYVASVDAGSVKSGAPRP